MLNSLELIFISMKLFFKFARITLRKRSNKHMLNML